MAPAPAPNTAPSSAPTPPTLAQTPAKTTAQTVKTPITNKPKSAGGTIAAVVIVILLIGGAVAGIFVYLKLFKKSSSESVDKLVPGSPEVEMAEFKPYNQL